MTKVLILGSTGLLGSTILKYFSIKPTNVLAQLEKVQMKKLKYINRVKLFKVDFDKTNPEKFLVS